MEPLLVVASKIKSRSGSCKDLGHLRQHPLRNRELGNRTTVRAPDFTLVSSSRPLPNLVLREGQSQR